MASSLIISVLFTSLISVDRSAAFSVASNKRLHIQRTYRYRYHGASSLTPLKSTSKASAPISISVSTPTNDLVPDNLHERTNQINNRALHVGNINWNVSCENVQNHLTKVMEGLDVQQIDIKPITKKPRDIGKQHGGSASIIFSSMANAKIAMERFQEEVAIPGDSEHQHSKIGKIKVRWAFLSPKTEEMNHTINNTSESAELSEERILHRQRRAEKYARRRRAIAQNTHEAIESVRTCNFLPKEVTTLDAPTLDWSNDRIPSQIDPMRGGGIRNGTERGRRKQAQVEAFLYVLKESLLHVHTHYDSDSSTDNISNEPSRKTQIVADLGSGAGNLSLPLAWFLKQEYNDKARIVAVDINDRALNRLNERANDINVDIETITEDLLNLSQPNPDAIGIRHDDPLESCCAILSLHACGAASDLAIQSAVSRSIPFAVSPCCIGKVKTIRKPDQMPSMISSSQRSGAPDNITYPRSAALRNILKEEVDYNLILTAADYSSSASVGGEPDDLGNGSSHSERGRMAKRIVETDRLKWAEERGYDVKMMEIPRLGRSYPKRELLVGAKRGTLAASRISQLASSTQLCAKLSNDDDDDGTIANTTDDGNDGLEMTDANDESEADRMDLAGFAGYLAPYALALAASIGVTAAFFKFVLLDY